MKRPIVFPYKSFKKGYYPIIKVLVKGPNDALETEAYVDSGASTSIFLADFASCLGIDYTKGKISYTMVGDGSFIPIYQHSLSVKIGHIWLRAKVAFSTHLGADFNLLGQKDVFDRFAITFDKRKKTISFLPY